MLWSVKKLADRECARASDHGGGIQAGRLSQMSKATGWFRNQRSISQPLALLWDMTRFRLDRILP